MKQVNIEQIPFNEIAVNSPVMYLSSHSGFTTMRFGAYRGLYKGIPVVEREVNERKWHYNAVNKWVQDAFFTKRRIRVFVKLKRVYSMEQIQKMLIIQTQFLFEGN